MHELIRGWRRKAGCIVLTMALVLLGLWLRAHFVQDGISYRSDVVAADGRGTVGSFEANRNGLTWNRYEGFRMRPNRNWSYAQSTNIDAGPSRVLLKSENVTRLKQSTWYVVSIGELQNQINVKMSYLMLSFWPVILMLTALSACLFVWKPRKVT